MYAQRRPPGDEEPAQRSPFTVPYNTPHKPDTLEKPHPY